MYENLRKVRKESGAKVKTLAALLQLKTEPAYFKKEMGEVRVTVEEALILARYFETTVEKLFA